MIVSKFDIIWNLFCRNHKFDKTDCNCGLTFTNTHQKKVHMWLTHSNGRYEKCELCSYVGPTRSMAAHREGHGKQSVCEVCGKAVAKTSQGTHWQNMHKEFQCPDCGEIIYGNRLYRRHRDRVHHEPFQCDQVCHYFEAIVADFFMLSF